MEKKRPLKQISVDALTQFHAQWSSQSEMAETSNDIARCFQHLLKQCNVPSEVPIYCPSLMTLAGIFRTNHLKIYDAFQILRQHGFDYSLQGMDAPVLFWHTPSGTDTHSTATPKPGSFLA